MDELLTEFVSEAIESLADLDRELLQLERMPDDLPTLSTIFRLVHTIKGTCGFLGLPRLEAVSHAAEDVLGRIRDRTLPASPAVVTLVLAGVDQIRAIVTCLGATGNEPDGDDAGLIATLGALAAEPVQAEPVGAAPVESDLAEASGPSPAETAEAHPAEMAVAVVSASVTGEPSAHGDAGMPSEGPSQTIRVGVDIIEGLMTLVSELVLTRNQLLQLARSQQDSRYTAPLQRLSHLTSDLQEGVMKTRMQPIGNAWNKLPRLVRELARDLGKQIEFQMSGEATELDRQVLELIRDPLTHVVRNSADHGLETPAVRRAAGKPETGLISLNAFHEGGHIIIEVADDGAGLRSDSIRRRVLLHGLATEAELEAMTERQINSFVFQPGFSTAAAVTAVSGRGVGLDVVLTNVERIGGTIDMQSTPGRGMVLTIKIPLTLAIISALIVETRGERFALPQTAVVELVRTCESDPSSTEPPDGPVIEQINGTPVLRLRDRLLPLIRLSDLLHLSDEPEPPPTGRCTVVVASMGSRSLGIVVDRVFDTEEIVVKPVAPMLRHIALFSGNTILGDGSVIMILDPSGIARAVGIPTLTERRGRKAGPAQRVVRTDDRSPMLLFRMTADGAPAAVPLGLVARIEELTPEQIERSSGRPVMQYRGRLMPLIELDLQRAANPGSQASIPGSQASIPGSQASIPGSQALIPVLVFVDRDRCMGLMVHEIVDVVEERLKVEVSAGRPGLLGTAVIAGRVTDVIDAGHWLVQACSDWFEDRQERSAGRPRVLVVEDSAFFRHLLVPALSTAGYDVTAVESAIEAIALCETSGENRFEAIISDIEMPEMDGLAFARRLRAGGPWSELPLIALSGRVTDANVECARAAGFTDFVEKFDRETLLRLLRTHVAPARQVAA